MYALTEVDTWVWVALLLIAVGPYTAIAAQTDLASDGFIRLKRMAQEPPITNSWVETIQGTKGEDGVCHYSIEFSAAAGDTTPQFAAVRAVDPTTCAFELVRGTPTYIPAIDGDGVVVEDEASASVSDSDQIAAQAQSTTQVRYSTYWEDPVELDVNKNRDVRTLMVLLQTISQNEAMPSDLLHLLTSLSSATQQASMVSLVDGDSRPWA